jgi:hypothetical protein
LPTRSCRCRDYSICDSTIGNILKAHGIEPAPLPKRTGSWETFLKSHWDVLASIDFTTVEVWTSGGLTTFYLLFVMELKTRRVNFAGCTTHPSEAWMKTIARELSGRRSNVSVKTCEPSRRATEAGTADSKNIQT